MPAARKLVVTLIAVPPFPVPEVGEGEIHDELSVTDQVRVPPPRFVMARVCAEELPVPCWTVKDKLVGLTPIAGGTGAAVTMKETGIVMGVTPVPPLRMTEPVWVPGAKVPVVACKVIVPFPVPEPAVRVNQPVFSLALQFKVPPPVLRTLRVCAAGLLPPWIAVKARLVGLAVIAGGTGAAVTMKETGIVTEDAPWGHSVTWPL